MKWGMLALLAAAPPTLGQVTVENQAAFIARAEQQGKVIEAMIAAAKTGNERQFEAAIMPGAVYMTPQWRVSILSISVIEPRAKACTAQQVMNPEVIGGRVTLPRDKAQILWRCPGTPALDATTIVEFSDMKVAFVRTIPGVSPIVTVAEPR